MSRLSRSWWRRTPYLVPGAISASIITLYASLTIIIGLQRTQQKPQYLPVRAQVQVFGQTLDLEVPKTAAQQARGLMYRSVLAENRGMLFEFNTPQHVQFWMKGVEVPLDMIFLREGRIVAIAANCRPCKTYPCPKYGTEIAVNQVIELNAGRVAELRLHPGGSLPVRFVD